MSTELLRDYLRFYQDLGIRTLYRREAAAATANTELAKGEAPLPQAAQAVPRLPEVLLEENSGMTNGLFDPVADAGADDTLEKIRTDIGDCIRCRLCEGRHKLVFGAGDQSAKLVFVGEGPGADEDAQGIPFVGRAGQLLTQMIENTAAREGISLTRENVYICNVVKCRPPDNRTPLPDEMETCGQFLERQLAVIQPKAIVALGGTAAKYLLRTKEGVTKLRGQWTKWRGIPLMVTYHPSYLLRQVSAQAKREAWEDLKKVLHFVYD